MFDPDICLCTGEGCRMKEKCLRHIYHLRASLEKDNYNTYFIDPPVDNSGNCDYKIEC